MSERLEIGTRVEVDFKKAPIFGVDTHGQCALDGYGRGRVEYVRDDSVYQRGGPSRFVYLIWFDKFVWIRENGILTRTDVRLTPVGENRAEHWLHAECFRKLSVLELLAEAAQ